MLVSGVNLMHVTLSWLEMGGCRVYPQKAGSALTGKDFNEVITLIILPFLSSSC